MRNAISHAEQLAVTLCFLATGETYTSLQYQFRINKGTLSLTIPRVCEATSTVLASYITCPSSEEEWLEMELAPIILITKGSSALCLWQSWALMQNLCLLMLVAKVALVMVEF